MAATYTATGDSFNADKPRLWSPGQFSSRGFASNYDVHPDGKRVVVLKTPSERETAPISKVNFVMNFFEEFRRKLPPGK